MVGQALGTRIDQFLPDRLLLRMAVCSSVRGFDRTGLIWRGPSDPPSPSSLSSDDPLVGSADARALVSTIATQRDVRVKALFTSSNAVSGVSGNQRDVYLAR